jgi:hypothetical protein
MILTCAGMCLSAFLTFRWAFPAVDLSFPAPAMRHLILVSLAALCAVSCVPAPPAPGVVAPLPPRVRIVVPDAPRGPVKVDISLATLTAQLLTTGGTLLAEMDISPGMAGHATPHGRFRVTEKLPLKRSNLYGQYVTPDTREVVVAKHPVSPPIRTAAPAVPPYHSAPLLHSSARRPRRCRPTFPYMADSTVAGRLEAAVCSVVRGQAEVVRKVLAAMLAGGHVLLEDFPGTGKTTLAKAMARAIGGAVFKRVQFTPDLLPSDILGISVFDPRSQEFRFHPGPVFTDILLADEINRASPRTQSACWRRWASGRRRSTASAASWTGCFS